MPCRCGAGERSRVRQDQHPGMLTGKGGEEIYSNTMGPKMIAHTQSYVTVGFLCGAVGETLIFVTGTSGNNRKISVSQQKAKVSCVYPKNHEKLVFGYPVLRSKPQRWIPELRLGYPRLRNSSKLFWEKLGIFLES